MEYGKAPLAIAATARPTSSGVPQRRIGVSPSAILAEYDSCTGSGHVRLDQARPDLVDTNPLPGQPDRKELGDHAQARLGHTVFRPVHAGERARDRA